MNGFEKIQDAKRLLSCAQYNDILSLLSTVNARQVQKKKSNKTTHTNTHTNITKKCSRIRDIDYGNIEI